MSKTKTRTIDDVRDVMLSMGDKLNDNFIKTEDLKVAQTAMGAYKTAINAMKTQIIYKKLTGMPAEIDFLK